MGSKIWLTFLCSVLLLSGLAIGCVTPAPQKENNSKNTPQNNKKEETKKEEKQETKITLESQLQEMLSSFKSKVSQKGCRVTIGNLTYKDSKVPSEFAQYLSNDLSMAISNCDFLEEYPRQKLEKIIEEMKLSQKPAFDEESAAELGKIKGLNAIFFGNYWPDGKRVKVYLRLVEVATGKNLYTNAGYIFREFIPQSVTLEPLRLEQTKQVLQSFQLTRYESTLKSRGLKVVIHDTISSNLSSQGPFQTKVWVNRGTGGLYRVGERMVVYLRANRNCYLRLYHISAAGDIQLIFPLPGMTRGNFIEGGRTYMIPRPEDNFSFDITEPLGTEVIKAIASTVPFKEGDRPFQSLGKASQENIDKIMKRGLKVRFHGVGGTSTPQPEYQPGDKPQGYITESSCLYTIIK